MTYIEYEIGTAVNKTAHEKRARRICVESKSEEKNVVFNHPPGLVSIKILIFTTTTRRESDVPSRRVCMCISCSTHTHTRQYVRVQIYEKRAVAAIMVVGKWFSSWYIYIYIHITAYCCTQIRYTHAHTHVVGTLTRYPGAQRPVNLRTRVLAARPATADTSRRGRHTTHAQRLPRRDRPPAYNDRTPARRFTGRPGDDEKRRAGDPRDVFGRSVSSNAAYRKRMFRLFDAGLTRDPATGRFFTNPRRASFFG